MNKPFQMALVCGRFQHIHNGHVAMVNRALDVAERVLILIGSAQESTTVRNPFSYETRQRLVRKVYPDERVLIAPLPDMTKEDDVTPEWGRFVLCNARQAAPQAIDVLVYGDDENRRHWFDERDLAGISSVTIAHDTVPIHATQLRERLARNDVELWKPFVPSVIHSCFAELRRQLLQVSEYKGHA